VDRKQRAWTGAALAAVAGVFSAPALAAPAAWTCWLHRGDQLACMSLADAEGSPVDAARVSQRDLMHAIRMRPGALRGQLVYIPMFTAPFDPGPVMQLANAVLCGAQPRDPCTVTMERDASRLGARARQAWSDANDPVLNR